MVYCADVAGAVADRDVVDPVVGVGECDLPDVDIGRQRVHALVCSDAVNREVRALVVGDREG